MTERDRDDPGVVGHCSVAVAIVTYRRPDVLRASLRRWQASRRRPDQLVIVDASPDAERQAMEVPALFPDLFAAPESVYAVAAIPSIARQRNLALDLVRADIVVFADDETEPDPDYLERLIEVYESDHEGRVGGVGGIESHHLTFRYRLKRRARDLGRLVGRRFPMSADQAFPTGVGVPRSLAALPVVAERVLCGNRMSVRADLAREQRFDERMLSYSYLEDLDLSVRIARSHVLLTRRDALIDHTPAPAGRILSEQMVLVSFVNPAYLALKLFPDAHDPRPLDRLIAMSELAALARPSVLRKAAARAAIRERYSLARTLVDYIRDGSRDELGERYSTVQAYVFGTRSDVGSTPGLRSAPAEPSRDAERPRSRADFRAWLTARSTPVSGAGAGS